MRRTGFEATFPVRMIFNHFAVESGKTVGLIVLEFRYGHNGTIFSRDAVGMVQQEEAASAGEYLRRGCADVPERRPGNGHDGFLAAFQQKLTPRLLNLAEQFGHGVQGVAALV